MSLFGTCEPTAPTDLSGTGKTGEFLRPIFTGTDEGTDLLLNTSYPVWVNHYVDSNGEPVLQPGTQLFLRFANDLNFDDEIFPDVEIPQFDPGDAENERWVGEISLSDINLIPVGSVVYVSMYRKTGTTVIVDDAWGFNAIGGI